MPHGAELLTGGLLNRSTYLDSPPSTHSPSRGEHWHLRSTNDCPEFLQTHSNGNMERSYSLNIEHAQYHTVSLGQANSGNQRSSSVLSGICCLLANKAPPTPRAS